MIKLMRRGFIQHKKIILSIGILGPVYMGYFGSRINNILLLMVFCGFLYGIMPLILFARDDKFKADAFGLSLPVTRREYIGSRYLLSWALMLFLFLAGSLLMILVPGGKLTAAMVFNPRLMLITLAFLTVNFGCLMPLFVRIGQVGLLAFLIGLQVLGVLLMVFRNIGSLAVVKKLFHLIPDGITAVQSALGLALAFPVLLAVLALLTYVSFEISVALFRRKEF